MTTQHFELIHTPDYEQIKNDFLKELTRASQGKPSSIFFFKHHLPEKPLVTEGIIQAIVIGGTNYIVSTVEIKKDGTRTTLKQQTGTLPILSTKQIFIDFMEEHLDSKAQAIGLNFGFAMKAHTGTNGEIDGVLTHSTKEHAFEGLMEEPIGKLIKDLYESKYGNTPKVSVANDTVCLTLSGDGTEMGSLVAGTGFNMCLAIQEKHKKILVNLECGNFNKFTLSPILRKIDADSEVPGGQLIEKATSGKYLALYFNEKIKKSHPEISPIRTSQELSELSHENHTDLAGDLARAIITRSAFLVASCIAAVYEFSAVQRSVPHGYALQLIGEGSLLWHGWHYEKNIYKQLRNLGIPEGRIVLNHIPDSSINGAIGLLTK